MKNKFSSFTAFAEKHLTVLFTMAILFQVIGIIVTYSLYGVIIASDTPSYVAPAQSFLKQGMFLHTDGTPIFFRTPGYPLLLALIYSVTAGSNVAVVVVQALMSIATGFILYITVRDVSKSKALALGALWLWSVCINNFYYVCCILTEIPFIFFFIMSLMWAFKYLREKKTFHAVLSFVFLMISLLIRPTVMYYCILLVFVLIVSAGFKKVRWTVVISYICIFAIAYGGWSMRNYHYYGAPLFTSIRHESYFDWYAPETRRVAEHIEYKEARELFDIELRDKYPDFDDLPAIEKVYAKSDIGKGYIKKHLPAFIQLNIKGLFLEMLGPGKAAISKLDLPKPLTLLMCAISSSLALLVYLIYAFGFLMNIRRLKFTDWFILFTNMYLMAGHAVLGSSRFRLSFFATCILGGLLSWRQEILKNKKQDSIAG